MKSLKYIPLALLSCFGLKALFLASNWPTLAAFGISVVLHIITEFVDYKDEISKFEKKLNLQSEEIEGLKTKMGHIVDATGALQTLQGFRPYKPQIK
jgi:hypothetical protein